jgi:hypothetical protein
VEIFGASGVLNNTDISLQLEYLGTGGSSIATFASSLPNALTASSALPTSSATWNNSPTGSIYTNTLDTTFNAANQTFSGGNLTTTAIGNSNQNARTLLAFTSGKIYFEATMVVINGQPGIGIGNANVVAGTYAGSTQSGFTYIANGQVYTNGGSATTLLAFGATDVICVAVDIANKKLWFRKNGLLWNNTAGNDPAANVGGLDLTTLLGINGTVYPQTNVSSTGDQVRINLGATAFAQAVPAGFTAPGSFIPIMAQHIQIQFTPQTAGRVRAQVRLRKALTTVWYNPQVTIS